MTKPNIVLDKRPNVRPGLPSYYLALTSPFYAFLSSMYPGRGLNKYYIEIDRRRFSIDTSRKDPYKQVKSYLIKSGFIDRLQRTKKVAQLQLPI